MARELEMKLIVEGTLDSRGLIERVQAHAEVGGGQERVQRDVYLDTTRAELAGAGLSARVRTFEGGRQLVVKLVPIDAGLVMDRAEITVELEADADPHAVLGALVRDRLGLELAAETIEVLRLRTRRTRHTVRTADMQAELAIDEVELDGAPGFTEVELELEQGDEEQMRHIAAVIADHPGVSPSGQSKLERARALAGLPEHVYATPLPRFDASWSAGRVARGVCWALVQTMRAYEPGTRIGLDPEQLHKMRVASRRLRTALRVFARCFDDEARDGLAGEAKWLGALLGEVRDLDVQRLALVRHREQLGAQPSEGWQVLEQRLVERHRGARARLVAGLDDPRVAALYARAEQVFGADAPDATETAMESIDALAPRLLRKRVRAFMRAVSRFRSTHAPSEAHRLRIVGKRLRYTGEFLAPLLDSEARRSMSALRAFQDRLGDIQDMVATGALARTLEREAMGEGPADPAYLFVLGTLSGAAAMQAALVGPLVDRALDEADADTLLATLRETFEGSGRASA